MVSYIRRYIKLEMVRRREIKSGQTGSSYPTVKIHQFDSWFGKELSQEIVNKTQVSKVRSVKV